MIDRQPADGEALPCEVVTVSHGSTDSRPTEEILFYWYTTPGTELWTMERVECDLLARIKTGDITFEDAAAVMKRLSELDEQPSGRSASASLQPH